MPKIDIWPPPNLAQFQATRYDVYEKQNPNGLTGAEGADIASDVTDRIMDACGNGAVRVSVFVVVNAPEEEE
jgi:phenylpyruvate tautomerase PptA (4-oxalocrotonate tautomerase family)